MWDRSLMQAKCWLCNSPFPSAEELTAFHTLITGVRDHGGALPFQQATFQLFALARLTPLRTPAARPRLIDELPWRVETPCHQLLSQWKSIKNNTHLHPWAQGPICFSCLPVAGAVLSKCLQMEKGTNKQVRERNVIISASAGAVPKLKPMKEQRQVCISETALREKMHQNRT